MAAPIKFIFLFWIFSFFLLFLNTCDGTRRDIYSTKTAYSWIYDVEQNVKKNEFMTTKYGQKHCVAVNSEIFLRHGARYPGYKDIRKMTIFHQKLKLTVKSPEFSFIQSWVNDFPESEEKQLVDEGADEQFGLGQRFGKRLFTLFDDSLNNVKFISSSKDRCMESAMSFYEGISDVVLHEAYDDLVPNINDDILRFHTKCDKYGDEVENNRTHMKYHKKFKVGPELKKVSENVQKRLGLEHAKIDTGELKLIYFWCTFEMIILDQDHWCKFLTEEEKEVIEYHNDLKQYWKKAYGHPIMASMACPLVNAMFSVLDQTVENLLSGAKEKSNAATFYFGHTETLAPLYAALRLFNDSTPLRDDNYMEMKSRVFKSSKILPFSANLAMVLYKCDYDEVPDPSVNDFVLRFYVNEQPVKIPACDDFVCPYEKVRRMYAKHIDLCNFKKRCATKNTSHDEL